MILHPAIIALLLGAFGISLISLYASLAGVRILLRWDLQSGSRQQLLLERKTYLISTILAYVMAFEVLSLFLLVFTADDLHQMFTGAMCAAGTFYVNAYGYPALLFKVAACTLCGLWLILNYVDNQGYDYPLIKVKYGALLLVTTFIVIETGLLVAYFSNLNPDIITSCCGTLFSVNRSSRLISDIVALPPISGMVAFYLTDLFAFVTGLFFLLKGKGGYLFAFSAALFFLAALTGILSFISPYFYALPTHHCPFDLLQREYGYIGYPLYATLFSGAISGMGVGLIHPFRARPSLSTVVPRCQKRLAGVAVVSFVVFTLIASWPIVFSDFKLLAI